MTSEELLESITGSKCPCGASADMYVSAGERVRYYCEEHAPHPHPRERSS